MARIDGKGELGDIGVYQDPDDGTYKPKRKVELTASPEAIHENIVAQQQVQEGPLPELTSASQYSQRIQQRKQKLEAAKTKGKPLGGAPPLDPQKMGELAGHLRAAKEEMVRPTFGMPQQPPPPPGPPPMQPEPMPPPQKPVKGVGAALPYNQAMAQGEVKKPMTLAQARRMQEEQEMEEGDQIRLTPQAKKIMSAAGQAPPAPHTEQQERPMEDRQQPSQPPQPGGEDRQQPPQDQQDLDDAEAEIAEDNITEVDVSLLKQLDEVRQTLYNPERRKLIESRLEPLELSDLILEQVVVQEIPVVQGRFHLTLKTLGGHENMFCLQEMYGVIGSERYVQALLNLYRVTCAVVAINRAPLPDHRKNVGSVDEEVDKALFKTKFKHVIRQATPILAEMEVQYDWFIARVNNLFSLDAIKNG